MADILKGRFGGGESGPRNPSDEPTEKPKDNVTEGAFGQPVKKEKPKQPKLEMVRANLPSNAVETNPETVEAFRHALEAARRGDPVGKELGKLILSIPHLDTIRKHIESLQGLRVSNDTLATAEQYWMSQSTEELVKKIESSNELDWSTNTATYMALVDEHRNRMQRLLENFRKK